MKNLATLTLSGVLAKTRAEGRGTFELDICDDVYVYATEYRPVTGYLIVERSAILPSLDFESVMRLS